MIVKRNRLLDESQAVPTNGIHVMTSQPENNSSPSHFGQQQQQQQQQDMTFGTLRDSSVNDENDEENIVIDMVDEDEDDEDDNDDGDDDADDEAGARREFMDAHHQARSTRSNQHRNRRVANVDSLSSDGHNELGDNDESRDTPNKQQQRRRQHFSVGDLIWFDPNQLGYAIPGKVIDFYPELNVLTVEGCCQPLALEDPQLDETTRNRLLVKADEQLQVYELSSDLQSFKSIRFRQPIGSQNGVANLIQLGELSTESIIWNLKLRFKQNLIYTKCGHKILVSVNPYKQLSELYDLDQVNQYDTIKNQPKLANLNYLAHNKFIRWLTLQQRAAVKREGDDEGPPVSSSSSQPASGDKSQQESSSSSVLAPHLFELANEALKKLLIQCQDQCFILLGDSGSGKTEAAKLLVQYFATVNKSPTNLMTEQILESIQMLESFGNAKTVLNNNSSRFGRLLEIRFSLINGFIQDARTVDLNLLDRSRIVCQNEGERNFNIFYELLAGLSKGEKEKYGLQTAEKYFYLNQGHCVELAQKEDGEDFRSLLASMQVLGFTYEEQDTIFRVLASILHLGNIYFHRKVLAIRSGIGARAESHLADKSPNGGDGGVEGVEIGSDTEARWVSHLLKVQFDLVMRCLTVRTVEMPASQQRETLAAGRGPPAMDCIATPLNIDQALDTRDAIARALYTCLFKWLVQRINLMINAKNDSSSQGTHNGAAVDQPSGRDATAGEQHFSAVDEEPIYLCRTSESLCEFQPDKLVANRRPTLRAQQSTTKQSQQTALISILDAFGFENLAENNFEQLCINYAAELLHYHTNRYLIRLEQAEYARERIQWQPMATGSSYLDPSYSYEGNARHQAGNSFGSNSSSSVPMGSGSLGGRNKQAAAIVNLISKKPLGILNLLDDECNFPKATDQSFAEKCHHNHALNENYQCARLVANCQEFGIRHFRQASRMVWYQVDGFIEKNRDSLRPDVMELLLGSKMTIVADMLRKIHKPFGSSSSSGNDGELYAPANSNNGKTLSRTYDGRYVSMKPRAGTVAARFQDTLNNNRVLETLSLGGGGGSGLGRSDGSQQSLLMNGINNNNYITRSEFSSHLANADTALVNNRRTANSQANTWFIVCLKPNRTKSAQIFDVAYVQEQVRSMNLLELVHMRKFGFPVRLRYGDFLKRYKCLVTRKFLAASCGRHLKQAGGQQQLPQNAINKDDDHPFDHISLDRSSHRSSSIRRAMRNVCSAILELKLGELGRDRPEVQQQHFQCGLSKMFLSEWLFHQLEDMRLLQYNRSILIIQKTWAMWLVRREFLDKRRAAIVIQAHLRGHLARRQFLKHYSLVVRLQRRWRRVLSAKRAQRLETRRRLLRQQQQQQLHELQMQQSKQANQLRFRLQAPARATDKTLDIPEDLAQLYRLQRNWLPSHDLTNVNEFDLAELMRLEQTRIQKQLKTDGRLLDETQTVGSCAASIPFVALDNDQLESIASSTPDSKTQISRQARELIEQLELDERYSIHALLTRYFSNQAPQFGYSRLPITRPFSWSRIMHYRRLAIRRVRREAARWSSGSGDRASTRSSLPKEQSIQRRFVALEQKAVAVYKLILRYIDSDQLFKLPDHLEDQPDEAALVLQRLLKFKLISDYINYLCLVEPLLRDEVYLQLISQTWQNPKLKSQENCWKLMLNCLACFDPLDSRLVKHLIGYASEYCCVTYKRLVCERLLECHNRLTDLSRRAGGRKRMILAAINSVPIAIQRQFPTTILECWGNQQATDQLAISGSCYMDEQLNSSSTQASADSANQQQHQTDDRRQVCQIEQPKDQLQDITNYSNQTVALVSSRSTAEQLAHRLLSSRGVPDSNLVGWSVEIQHEGALSEFSSRLRGDDHLFDHLARLELLPELVQLIDDDLEALECEQLDELGLGGALGDHGGPDLEAAPQLESDLPSCCRNASPVPAVDDCCRQASVARSNYSTGHQRLSVHSQGSWDLNSYQGPQSPLSSYRRRHSAAMSELDLQMGGEPGMFGGYNHHAANHPDSDYYGHSHYSQQPSQHQNQRMNRRSMSMQELLLATSSALNGRYFMQQHAAAPPSIASGNSQLPSNQQQHYAASCLSSNCCGPPASGYLPRSRRHSGSLRQLDQSRQGSYAPSAGYYQARRRSTTPNSMISNNRLSASSAYGSHSSRFNQAGATGNQPMVYGSKQAPVYMSSARSAGDDGRQQPGQHSARNNEDPRYGRSRLRAPGHNSKGVTGMPGSSAAWSRRSASTSSRGGTGVPGNSNKPSSDYASAHSDYEQITHPHHQQQQQGQPRPQPGAGRSGRQQADPLGDSNQRHRRLAPMNKQPVAPTGKASSPNTHSQAQYLGGKSSASVHYAATSSAMSDTSEAPSLASHVRRIKVPQPNGDLDKYLDDLFNPLLDGADLDELSDARSMATSIRGVGRDDLSALCDPVQLSRIIRGTDEPKETDDQELQNQLQRAQTLSPTFESLLRSLKSVNESELKLVQGDQLTSTQHQHQQKTGPSLDELNLSQLKALNEKLESEIQAAQSARASLELTPGPSGFGDIMESPAHVAPPIPPPIPPPQPSFSHLPVTSAQLQTEQLIDDIYSRAKTIRIGKWRWPPALTEQEKQQLALSSDTPVDENKPDINDKLVQERRLSADTKQDEAKLGHKEEDEHGEGTRHQQDGLIAANSTSVGRLKISSEMKAKLEQLTNSSGSSQEPTTTGSTGSSDCKSTTAVNAELDAGQYQQPKRLDDQRRNLLASQLLGAKNNSATGSSTPEESPSRRDSGLQQPVTGSKVLAVKQQLAAAAGVALSALDSSHSGASSQTSSRRQSSCQPNNDQQRRLVLEADELGPQSRGAINQRQAFYLNDEVEDPRRRSLLKDEESIKSSECTSRATSKQIAANPSGANQSTPATNELGGSGGGAKNLNTCLLKHKQEISQAKTMGQKEADNETRSGYASGQWVSSSSSSSCVKDKQSVDEIRTGRHPERQSLVAATTTTTNTSKRKQAEQVETSDQGPQQQQQLASQKRTRPIACLAYANVDWQVRVRKEVFKPSESYDNELVVQLVFAQLVADVFNPRHWTRLNNKERAAIKSIMKDNSIGYAPSLPGLGQMQAIKRELVRMARSFGLYFTRSYQALNFACLSETYLDAFGPHELNGIGEGGSMDGSSDDSDTADLSDDSSSSSSASSLFGPEHKQRQGDETRPARASARLALKLAHRLRSSDRLGLDWIDMVAVHHSGLRLVALVCDQTAQQQDQRPADRTSIRNSKQFIANQIGVSSGDAGGPPTPPIGYKVLETLKFRDMTDVRLVSERVLLVSMRANGAGAKQARHKSWLVSSSQANQLAALLRDFLADYNKNVRASSSKSASADCAKRQEQTQWAQTDDRRQPQGSDEFSKHQQFKASKTQLVGTRLPGDQRGRIHESSSNDNRRQDALLATDDAHDGDHLKQRQTANSIDKLRKTANPNNVLADTKRALSNDLAHSHASASPSNTSGSGHSGPGKQSGSNRSGSGGPSGNQSSPTAALPSVDGHGKRPGSGSNDSTTTTRSTSSPIPAPGGNNSNKYRGEPGGGSDAGRGRPDHHSATSITNATNNNQDDTAYPVEQQQYERAHSSNESLDEQQQPSESQLNNTASKQNRERPPAPEGDSGGQLIGGAQGKKRQTAPTNTTTTTTTTTTRSGKQSSSGQSLWQNSLSRMSNRFSLFGGVHSSAASTFKHQFGAKKNKKRLTSGEPPAQDEAGDQLATSRQPDVVLDAWIEAKMDFGGEDDELQDESTTGLDSSATQHGPLNMLSSSSSLSSPKANDVNNKNQDNSESGLKSGSRKDSETASRSDQKQYGSLVAGSNQSEDNNNNNNNNDAPTKSTKADDGKYSMLQFALYNFREAIDKYSLETRLSINNSKQPVQAPHDDWSTLRGSLKLIESLRTRSDASTHNNSSSSQSTISSTKTLTKMVANEHQQQQQQQQQRADSGQQAPSDWTWRELAQMVKYTSTPLKRSLLKLSGGGDQHETSSSSSSQAELERRAIDCFAAIMRYMGDLKPSSETTSHKSSSSKQHQKQQVPDNEVECVYLILINCHNHPQLRDEVYCQLIKQTTNNRSAQPDSCLRGWRLFSLLAAYFDCSARFRPYLLNYLEQNAFDKRRSYHSIALLCLQNLRKTFKCGGRKNVPSIEEIAALSAGRISKRQIYRLPGGTERVINTKSTTVVDDIIHEICSNMLMITQPNEMLEFSLYCIADGDSYTMPLNRDEYILDITTELIKNHQQYFLIFCRSVWHYPLRLDSKFYIEVTFNQIAPDYLEGLFLVMPRQQQQQKQQHNQKRHTGAGHYATSVSSNSSSKGGSSSGAGHHYQSLGLSDKLIREIARLGALLHRASSTDYMPHKDEIKYLLPRPIVASIKQQLKTGGANGARAPRGEQQLLAAASGEQTDQAGDSGQQGMMPDQQTWTTLVQDYWREMSAFDALDAKAQFLDIIRHWPLFGSSFFAIKLIQRDLIQPLDYILALNKFGIQMLDMQTHETHQKYSFNEVISTRKVRSEDGALYLDMKCGNLLKRTIIRIQTDQAHEISRLVRQYIDIELSQASSKQQQQQQSQQSQQPIGGDTESRSSLATNDNQVGGDHMTTPNCD